MVDATNSLDARNLNFVPYPDFLFALVDSMHRRGQGYANSKG
jgi:hypothetical protein